VCFYQCHDWFVVALFLSQEMALSVFEGGPIPYPKREFIKDDEPEDNPDTVASKVGGQKVSMLSYWPQCIVLNGD